MASLLLSAVLAVFLTRVSDRLAVFIMEQTRRTETVQTETGGEIVHDIETKEKGR